MIDINRPEELDTESPEEINIADLLGEDVEDLIENEDGSVEIPIDGVVNAEQKFDDNLAEHLPQSELRSIALDMLVSIEDDINARKKRDEQYEEGLRRTGLGNDAPGGASFNGASRVVHPALAESCVDFAARAIKEIFPASGPVRMETTGVVTPEEEDKSSKIAACLNNQYTRRIKEFRHVTEQKLTQLPLGGSQFTKLYFDMTKNRICAEFVPIDDLFLPFYADSFYEADRVTHRQYLSKAKIEERIADGQYRDVKVINSILDPERSATSIANDKVEGKENTGFNEDGVRPIYEVYVWMVIEDDQFSNGKRAPYIISLDPEEYDVLSIRRNWEEDDPQMEKLDWLIEDMFIPWRGAYGIGLPHLIGSLSGAATGALRALLDSAHINNAPTLLKLKNSRMSGQTKQVDVTTVVEMEGPTGVDDIRKYLMPMPFNEPSGVLFQLLGWLTDAAKGVVSTASEKIADATSNTPVGTTQALIEQGSIIFSSIHARLHFSQSKVFEITLRLLKRYAPQELMEYGLNPEDVTMKGVHPVSDPHIFSEAQRMAQMQSLLKLAESAPQLYNQPELHRNALSLLKINNYERFLLPPPPQPQPMDPAAELLAFMQNAPVAVVPQQDHMSHIIVHVNYLKDPMLGMNPIMVPITAKVLDHLREHLAQFFSQRLTTAVQQISAQAQQQTQQLQLMLQSGQVNPSMIDPSQMQPPQPEATMAKVSDQIVSSDEQMAAQALEVIVQADKFVKDNMRQQDPNLIAAMADIERKRVNDEAVHELAVKREENLRKLEAVDKIETDKQNNFDRTMEQAKADHERRFDLLTQQIELLKNDADNRQKQLTELLKNHEDNKTAIIVEQIRQLMSAQPKETLSGDKQYIDEVSTVTDPVQNADSTVPDQ